MRKCRSACRFSFRDTAGQLTGTPRCEGCRSAAPARALAPGTAQQAQTYRVSKGDGADASSCGVSLLGREVPGLMPNENMSVKNFAGKKGAPGQDHAPQSHPPESNRQTTNGSGSIRRRAT